MRILIYCPFRLESVGGVVSAVRSLAAEFVAQGHEVNLLIRGNSCIPQPQPEDPELGPQVAIHAVDFRPMFLDEPGWANLRQFCACLAWLPLTLWGVSGLLRKVKPEVVVVQYPYPRQFYWGLLRLWSAWKLVLTFQGNDAHNVPRYSPGNRWLLGRLLKRADIVTFVSESLRQKISSYYTVEASKCRVIPNGAPIVQTDGTCPSPVALPSKYIMTAGKLIQRKGIDLLIRAVGDLRRSGQDLPLAIFGDGEERVALQQLARSEGVEDLIIFCGEQKQAVVYAAMKHTEAFLLASRAEGLPLVVAEAMANGAPVVATRVDGTPQIVIDNETGLLVEPENVGELVAAIQKLRNDAALASRLRRSGLEAVVSRFSWPVIATQYVSTFQPT